MNMNFDIFLLDLCVIEKTNTGQAREVTQCDINKVLIGKVT